MPAEVAWEDAYHGIIQGNPGALKVLDALKQTCPAEFPRLVLYLYEHGPRGHRLWERYSVGCERDALKLSRDLMALASEWEG